MKTVEKLGLVLICVFAVVAIAAMAAKLIKRYRDNSPREIPIEISIPFEEIDKVIEEALVHRKREWKVNLGAVYIKEENPFMNCVGYKIPGLCFTNTFEGCMSDAGKDHSSARYRACSFACGILMEEGQAAEEQRKLKLRALLFDNCRPADIDAWSEDCVVKAYKHCIRGAEKDKDIVKYCKAQVQKQLDMREDLRLLVKDLEGGRME